jgi:hypothetical protein
MKGSTTGTKDFSLEYKYNSKTAYDCIKRRHNTENYTLSSYTPKTSC